MYRAQTAEDIDTISFAYDSHMSLRDIRWQIVAKWSEMVQWSQ